MLFSAGPAGTGMLPPRHIIGMHNLENDKWLPERLEDLADEEFREGMPSNWAGARGQFVPEPHELESSSLPIRSINLLDSDYHETPGKAIDKALTRLAVGRPDAPPLGMITPTFRPNTCDGLPVNWKWGQLLRKKIAQARDTAGLEAGQIEYAREEANKLVNIEALQDQIPLAAA